MLRIYCQFYLTLKRLVYVVMFNFITIDIISIYISLALDNRQRMKLHPRPLVFKTESPAVGLLFNGPCVTWGDVLIGIATPHRLLHTWVAPIKATLKNDTCH